MESIIYILIPVKSCLKGTHIRRPSPAYRYFRMLIGRNAVVLNFFVFFFIRLECLQEIDGMQHIKRWHKPGIMAVRVWVAVYPQVQGIISSASSSQMV